MSGPEPPLRPQWINRPGWVDPTPRGSSRDPDHPLLVVIAVKIVSLVNLGVGKIISAAI